MVVNIRTPGVELPHRKSDKVKLNAMWVLEKVKSHSCFCNCPVEEEERNGGAFYNTPLKLNDLHNFLGKQFLFHLVTSASITPCWIKKPITLNSVSSLIFYS